MRYTHPDRYEDDEFFVPSKLHGFLWMHELKATKPRLELLDLLSKEKGPLSAADIYKKIAGKGTRATVFRTLEQFCKRGLVIKIQNYKQDSALYEIKLGRPHHHYVFCISCGDMEDVHSCNANDLNVSALTHLKNFKSIQSHSLEFFGLCRKCEDKPETK